MTSITIQTNYNNKLSCTCFTHIDQAPLSPISEKQIQETVFEIKTSDNSHPPIRAKLVDICRLPLSQIDTSFTWPSHGMTSAEFFDWILTKKPTYTLAKPMAVYYYRQEMIN